MNDEERAAFRAFVRDHHPDRGGDPDVFIAGLAGFRASEPEAAETQGGRFDAPIEVVTPLPVPLRVAVALFRTFRRHRDRRVV